MFVFSKAKREMAVVRADLTPEEMTTAKGGGGGHATYAVICFDQEWVDPQGNTQTTEVCYFEMTDWDS